MRIEDYRFELVTPIGVNLGILEGIETGGRLTGNVNAQTRWSAQLTYHGDISKTDWYKYRIKIIAIIDEVEYPLGVYVVRGGEEQKTEHGNTITLDLYDKTFIPASDAVEDTYTVQEGTNIGTAIRALLASTGETNFILDTISQTANSALVWEAGTSKLRIINDLLDACGYMALWCDWQGTYRLTPYLPPKSRPVAYKFTQTPTAIHLPDFTRTQEAKIPNKIICISQESGDQPAMRAVAVNENPDSPYSFQNQGVWVAETHTGVEAASQQVLNDTANRLLASATVSATLKRQMALTPLELNAVCVNSMGGREVIENIDITLTPAELMNITTREVN